MKSLKTSPYTLSGRRGALLKVDFEGIGSGYADCHPWELFGELPIELQIERLKAGSPTPLGRCSLDWALLDALARKEKRSLFTKEVPRSHFLVLDLKSSPEKVPEEYGTVKLKVGKDRSGLRGWLEWALAKEKKIRLDFNYGLAEPISFLRKLGELSGCIEWIEDPFPFDEKSWIQAQEKTGVAFACDWFSERAIGKREAAPYLVVKPARQKIEPFFAAEGQKLAVTSSMDHPLGQLAAAYAATLGRVEECGLLTHLLLPSCPFSERLAVKKGSLLPPGGPGFGFSSELEELPWR